MNGRTGLWLALVVVAGLWGGERGARADTKWHVPTADLRFAVAVADTTPGDSGATARVTVCLTGLPNSHIHPVMFSATGERIGCRALHADVSERTTVLFDATAAARTPGGCTLYFVDREALGDPPVWNRGAGLLLETRTCSETPDDFSVAGFRQAWERAEWTNGISVVERIHDAFPRHPSDAEPPRELAAVRRQNWLLNRYTGWFRIPSGDTNALQRAVALRDGALAKREAAFQDREALKQRMIETVMAYQEARKNPEAAKVRPEVLYERLMDIQKQRDEATKLALDGTDRMIRPAEAVIERFEESACVLLNGADYASHLLVNGESVLSWPPGHSLQREKNRVTNLRSVSLSVTSAVHQIEYLHWAGPTSCVATVGWRPPGERHAQVMPPEAFLPLAGASVSGLTYRDPTAARPYFTWRIATDLRCPGAADLVDVQFAVAVARPGFRYLWDFGDGQKAEGESITHLYMGSGTFPVTVREVPANGSGPAERELCHPVGVHVLWDKHRSTPLAPYERRITGNDLREVPIEHVLNAYNFARRAATGKQPLQAWREWARRALAARLDDLPREQACWAKWMADDAAQADSRAYGDARIGYEKAVAELDPGDPLRAEAELALAELLVDVFGEGEEALVRLQRLDDESHIADTQRVRFVTVRANALLAVGKKEAGVEALEALAPQRSAEEASRLSIRERALLNRARRLAGEASDRDTLDYAMELVETLMTSDPTRNFSPELCLIRADIYLARQEYERATTLMKRLLRLDPGPWEEEQARLRLQSATHAIAAETR
jgi:hypothetical protein